MWLLGIVQARLSTESRLRATEGSVSHRESELDPFEWHLVLWTNLFLAMLALADAVKTLRMDRRIADKYTAANSGPRRSSILKEHQELRKDVIGASIAAFTLAGLYGSAALYGTTFQLFSAVQTLFTVLVLTSFYINFVLLVRVGCMLCFDFDDDYDYDLIGDFRACLDL